MVFNFGAGNSETQVPTAPANNSLQNSAKTAAQPPISTALKTTEASAAGSFSFGNNLSGSNTTPQVGALAPLEGNSQSLEFSLIVPKISDVFPYVSILSKIRNLQNTSISFESQELIALIKKYKQPLSNPPPPTVTQADNTKRKKLESNPYVELNGRPAALTLHMLQEVYSVADTLYLSEEDAMTLYAEASQAVTREWLQDTLKTKLQSVPEAAKELFFLQRRSLMQSILLLCQCRLQANNGEFLFVELTDELLINDLLLNLVALIRKLSEMILRLVPVERQKSLGANVSSRNPHSSKNTAQQIWKEHLQHERQIAIESIFYLTYSTQCTEKEVTALVDLVQELTNDRCLPDLDPFKDVPEPYHSAPEPQTWAGPFTQALPALREKSTWEWEKELVEEITRDGDGAILPTVAVLVLAVISALDTQQIFIDRKTHLPNEFGKGNTLFLTPSNTIRGPLQERFKSCGPEWNRKDIWGILSAAYALGLRPINAVVTSPRAQPSGDGVKRTWKTCLIAPCQHKSFTCLRLTLLPSIRRHKTTLDERCELYEFSMSVLSEFMSLYLDVLCASNAVPLSRARWEDTENDTLQFKREEQERERSFYMSYGGGTYKAKETIASGVNLLERPDCVDDVIALATAICSRGPSYAASFWSRDKEKIVPSRALKKLEFLQEKDSSLIPTHLSFLAALAIAEPSVVFDILNKEATGNDKLIMNWTTIFSNMRWYVHKMSDAYAGKMKPIQKESPIPSVSTSYYYNDEDGVNSDASRLHDKHAVASRSNQLKELDDTNTAIVLSHLAIVTKVADNYAAGRAALVSMKLSIDDSANAGEEDSILLVLFSLAIAPLTPTVRGAVLATIAALLSIEGKMKTEEKKMIEEAARRGWDLLELIQAVPVLRLDQYQGTQQGLNIPTMAFPPSSISAINNGSAKAWLPPDPKYGIVFEMEHIESRLGFYPSTEGMLQLLLSLVKTSGCPYALGREEHGKNGRIREGCTPYIEYIVNFVLPRALGSPRNADQLPFKTGVDSARLITRALAVLEAVIVRYETPPQDSNQLQEKFNAATSLLKIREVASRLLVSPSKDDFASFELDFKPEQTNLPVSQNAKTNVSLPRLKSPGFLVLADLLAASNSDILRVLSQLLAHDGRDDKINKEYGSTDLQYRVTWARFGDTKPSVFSAKHKRESSPTMTRQSLLARLLPQVDVAVGSQDSLDPIYWRANGILTSLRILGAAAIREQNFIEAVRGVTSLVPALQFNVKTNVVQKKEIHLVKIRNAISGAASPELRCLSSIAQYLVSICSDESQDTEIAGAALALLAYSFSESNINTSLAALDAQSINGELYFTRAVAERLTIACGRTSDKMNSEIVLTILLLIQSELSNVLLGFPHKSIDGLRTEGIFPSPHQLKHNECLSVLLECLSNDDFLTNPTSSSIALKIFEIIIYLTSTNDTSPMGRVRADYLSTRLNSIDFWNGTMLKFLAYRTPNKASLLDSVMEVWKQDEGSENVLRCAAWLFNGIANHFIKNIEDASQKSLSRQNQILLSNLLDQDHHLLCNAIEHLPRYSEVNQLTFPTHLLPLQQTIESCMFNIDESQHQPGYFLVNTECLIKKMNELNTEASKTVVSQQCLEWVMKWNQSVRWDHACAYLSSAIMNLIEASLEFSAWSLQSGLSNLLHNSTELRISREYSLLQLLDQILDILVEQNHTNSIPSLLSKPVSLTLSTEVLMIVERLLSTRYDRASLSHYILRISMATLSSLNCNSPNQQEIDEEERSIFLGSALCKCLKAENIENEEAVNAVLCKVVAAFGSLSLRQSHVKDSSDINIRKYQVSLASRTILCSLARSMDKAGSGAQNIVVVTLATTSCTFSTSKNILQALVNIIPTMDSNIYLFLQTLSSCEGGANILLRMGILKSLSAATINFTNMGKLRQLKNNSADSILLLTNILELTRSLLISLYSNEKENTPLHEEFQKLLISCRLIIREVWSSFPTFGECWLSIVQVMAAVLSLKKDASSQIRFRNIVPGMVEPSSLVQGTNEIVGYIVKITENLIQSPFPNRFLPILPQKLQNQAVVIDSWWETVEQHFLGDGSVDHFALPDPPTGLTYGWSKDDTISNNKYGPWTKQKYEACLSGEYAIDASLSVLLEQVREESEVVLEFDSGALARGLCRLADSSAAVIHRLRDIEKYTEDISSNLGVLNSRSTDSIVMERVALQELCPLIGRNCEKLLMLSYNIYQRLKLANEEFHRGLPSNPSPVMKQFRSKMILALEHTRLRTNGVLLHIDESVGSSLSKLLAKKLQESLENNS